MSIEPDTPLIVSSSCEGFDYSVLEPGVPRSVWTSSLDGEHGACKIGFAVEAARSELGIT